MTRRGVTAAVRGAVLACARVVFDGVVFEAPLPHPARTTARATAAAGAPILAVFVVENVLIAGFSRGCEIAPFSPAITKDAYRHHFFPSTGGEGFAAQGVLARTNPERPHPTRQETSVTATAKHLSIRRAATLTLGVLALLVAGCGGSSGSSSSAPPSTSSKAAAPAAPASPSSESASAGIPQNNEGDHDSDNNGGPSDGDGNQ